MVGDLNKCFNLDLSTDLAMHRGSNELAGMRVEVKVKCEVVGASNGERLAEVMEKKGFSVSCSATPGWRLTGQNAKLLAEKIGGIGEEDVLFLSCMDWTAAVLWRWMSLP
jgi:phage gp16-like protein